ncbi:MAG: hypothetical protein IT290_06680, partial [Deltaproteobacteria bacterium]|nr:hypothetical protein [Deltaproteobacteria bacterium]
MRTVLLHVLIMFLVATTARAETLSEIANAFDGQRVTEIRFRTNLNLDAGDLGRNLPLQVGDRLSPAELLESVTVLQDRGIFEHVDVTVRPTNAGVRIDFLLTPLLRVGEIDIVGGEELDRDRIRRATGFRAGSAFQASVLRRSVERLTTFFASMGYYDARTLVHVLERPNAGDLFIRYELDLGRQAEIGEVRFAKPISEENRERVERIKMLIREILLALRAEGYLQSSVRLTSKTIEPGSGLAQLELNITERTPVTMYFRGNTAFTPTELLSPLKLDTRTVLFSPTAIPALCRAIEKMYQERGYFLVKVDCSVAPSDDDRRVYNITIDEGARLRLRSLAFEGESEIGPQELSSAVTTEEAGPFFLRVWQPGYVINETVAQDVVRLEELYRDRGYNEATVQPLFTLDESGDAIQGTFQIDQGDPVLLETVETQWLHPDGTPIGATDIPAELRDVTSGIVAGARSSPGALDYERERLLALILERGFPEVIVAVALSDDGKSAQISITPGALVRVRKIVVRGNYYTHDDVIRRDLRIAPGDLWTPIPLERTTQELLKTGLFRTVLLEPADGALDSSDEDLAVTVEERDTGTFDLGVGLDTEDGLHLTGELGQRNFEGNGDAIVLVMDAYFKNGDRVFDAGRIKGLYRRPHFITPSNDL